ncbi:MAG: 50S ribosomal protein L3 N(5)-glutamine methyltransferase [Gammaproteobacteria bacterium]
MRSAARGAAPTPRALIRQARAALARARLHYGHGTTTALEDARFLVLHALGLPVDADGGTLDEPCSPAAAQAARALVRRRIATRAPAAYLAGRMWFAGLEFEVDERVLVPRSPIAEVIESGFSPWIDPDRVRRVLDIGTGSGCIAIASAVALPWVHADATDLSQAALEVAAANVRRHRVGARVKLHRADLFPPGRHRYDVIVSNPPYVRAAVMRRFPAEYRHEPRMAFDGGRDGLDLVRRIVDGAARHLTPEGILVVEVGAGSAALEAAYPGLPFTWLEFQRGGEGVFVLRRRDLEPHA